MCVFAHVGDCMRMRACVDVGAKTRAFACARVALLILRGERLRHIVYVLSGSTTFFEIIS